MFISFTMSADIFRAPADEADAMAVVRCSCSAVMEHLVRSRRATDCRDFTTCLAKVFTLCACPLLAMAVISCFSFASSRRTRSMSRSSCRFSVRIWRCHSRAFFTVSWYDFCDNSRFSNTGSERPPPRPPAARTSTSSKPREPSLGAALAGWPPLPSQVASTSKPCPIASSDDPGGPLCPGPIGYRVSGGNARCQAAMLAGS
mmetsp:Transcript_15675/g.33352  ORF Transcript_15675/g.33352 Transcript_15675/m.33352 type:complete len:202 (-) Transcript_15675:8-613(-)